MSRRPSTATDEASFEALFERHRGELRVHCYRMLGSFTDADDLLQETLLAAWRGLGGFRGQASVRTWLYRIATNRCLNAIRDARRRPPTEPVPPFDPPPPSTRGEVTWLQPYPDSWLDRAAGPEARSTAREAVELAFVAALQRLPPRQTAALVLCDVLGFSQAEVAEVVGGSATTTKGLLQRARAACRVEGPEGAAPQRPGVAAEGSREEERLARRFAEALMVDDVDGVVELLGDDAFLAMPPAPHEYRGRDAVGAFLRASARGRGGRHLHLTATRANRAPAFICRLPTGREPALQPDGVIVLEVHGGRIAGVTRFLVPALVERFLAN